MNKRMEEKLKQKSLTKLMLQLNNDKIALRTVQQYLSKISKFRTWINASRKIELKNEDELIEFLRETNANELVLEYMAYMNTKNISTQAINDAVFGIHKILRINKIQFDWETIRQDYLPTIKSVVSDRIPTKQELTEIFNSKIDLRDKVMLLMGIHGLRGALVLSLKQYEVNLEWGNQLYKDIKGNAERIKKLKETMNLEQLESIKGLGLITVHKYDKHGKVYPHRKMKKIEEYYIILSRECVFYIKKYIKERSKYETVTNDSPLLTTSYGTLKGKHLKYDYCTKRFRKILHRIGFNKTAIKVKEETNVNRYELHFQTLRKYFRSHCTNAGVKTGHSEGWLGHAGRHLEDAYEKFKGNELEHALDFMKVEQRITIYGEKPRLNKVESEIDVLRRKLAKYEQIFKVEVNGKKVDLNPKGLKDKKQTTGQDKETGPESQPKAVMISIDDLERYAELVNKGYKVTLKNSTHIVMQRD